MTPRIDPRVAAVVLSSPPTSPFGAKISHSPRNRILNPSATTRSFQIRNTPRLVILWYTLPYIVTIIQIIISPYTKVEETPILHAVHDILKYGLSPHALSQYDHVIYPGPVPRSFIPAFMLAWVVQSITCGLDHVGLAMTGLQTQILIRALQAVIFCLSFNYLTTSLSRSFSPMTAKLFVLLSMSQFHLPYYAGRTLPNSTALPLVILAFSIILRTTTLHIETRRIHSYQTSLALLAFVSTLLRLEIAPIAGALALIMVYQRRLSLVQLTTAGSAGGLIALTLSFTIDTYFYAPTDHTFTWWPEMSAAVFNIVQGKASEWGTSPWWYYLASLPKLVLGALPFALIGIVGRWRDERTCLSFGPIIASVGVLSLVGHKEWRFIVYVIPLLNLFAAVGAEKAWNIKSRKIRTISRAVVIAALICDITLTGLLTYISHYNYPGGEIGGIIDDLARQSPGHVWLSAAALHSGTNLFTFPISSNLTIHHPESAYLRCANPHSSSLEELYQAGYDLAVVDDLEYPADVLPVYWSKQGEVVAFRRVSVGKVWPYVRVDQDTRLVILERNTGA